MNKKIFILLIVLILIIILLSVVFIIFCNKKNEGNEIAAINLYEELIDKILENRVYESDNYISIDTTSFIDPLNNNILSESAQTEILDYCRKYNKVIYKSSDIDLKDESLEGVKITFNIRKKKKETINIDVNCYRSNLGSGGREYICTYSNNTWNISNGTTVWSS